jgi:hypothetical protein
LDGQPPNTDDGVTTCFLAWALGSGAALRPRIELAKHAFLAVQNEIGWIVSNIAGSNGLRMVGNMSMALDRIGAVGISRTGNIAITAMLRSRGQRPQWDRDGAPGKNSHSRGRSGEF